MSFLEWFYRKLNPESSRRHEAIVRRLSELDARLGKLESGLENEKPSAPPLLIQHADKVVIEKVDLSNHLGTLQIETLEGQLNIGVTYHGTSKPDELFPLASAESPPASPPKPAGSSGSAEGQAPQYRIRARTKNDRPAK